MAKFINCKTCEKEVASSAKVCPGCGAKLKTNVLVKILITLVALFGFGIVVSILGGNGNSESNSAVTSSNYKNQISWAAFKATRSTNPQNMWVYVELGDYYNYEFSNKQDTYWSISLYDIEKSPIQTDLSCYVRKDSEEGQKLFQFLQDGKTHIAQLELRFDPLFKKDGNVLLVTKLVSTTEKSISPNTGLSSEYKNPISWAVFRAERPSTPQGMWVKSELDDYYNWEFDDKQDTYWSIRLYDGNNIPTYGYVQKDSENGQRLFQLLQDGKQHIVPLALHYDPSSDKMGNVVVITKLVDFKK